MALDFAAGCVGGMAGIIAGHPLDTVKVLAQAGRGGPSLPKLGTVRSLYRGVGPPLVGVAGVNAIVFGAYGSAYRALPDPESLRTHALAGAAAGLLQCAILSPVELVKTRQQLCGLPSGTWAGVKQVLRSGGVRALYRGLSLTAARDTPAFAIYFASYEAMSRGDRSAARVFFAGGAAGTLSWVLLYPIDVIKSRVQADSRGKYAGAWDCAKRSIRDEGWACMRRGLAAVTVRAFVSNGACFSAVAWTERAWHAWPAWAEDVAHSLHADTLDLTHAELHDAFPHFQYAT